MSDVKCRYVNEMGRELGSVLVQTFHRSLTTDFDRKFKLYIAACQEQVIDDWYGHWRLESEFIPCCAGRLIPNWSACLEFLFSTSPID